MVANIPRQICLGSDLNREAPGLDVRKALKTTVLLQSVALRGQDTRGYKFPGGKGRGPQA